MLASKFCRNKVYSKTSLNHAVFSSTAAKPTQKNVDKKALYESKSFCLNLFRGRAIFDQVIPYPLKLSEDRRETLQMVLAPIEKHLEEVNDPFKNDETSQIPIAQLKKFAELGVFGAVVPEKYEGAGLGNVEMAKLSETVGKNDLALGVVMGAHQSIGYKGILLMGTEEQKKKYLPDLATGRKFAAFCLTEPASGSDANSIRTRAQKSEDGKHYILNGGKIWITNGGFADVFTVFAQTPVKQADGSTKDQISAFIVERGFGGVTNGQPEKKMGIKGSNTAEVHFENVKIPVENLLGKEGEGFKISMNILNNGRFGLPANCTGSMKHCLQKTVEHVTSRVQFGKKIMEYGNVQEKIADMVQRIYVTESIVYMLASNMDSNVMDYQLEAAMAKVIASENAWHVCDEAIQLYGGMGFMRETGLERILRDLRIFRIFEGENDILRLFIASTGMKYAGNHLKELARTVKATGNASMFFGELKRRNFGDPGACADFVTVVHRSLKESARLLNADVKAFGQAVESLLAKHRDGITGRQYELIRIANAAIDIYSIAAVLSRATYALNKSEESAKHDLEVAQLFTSSASKRIQDNLKEAYNPDSKDLEQTVTIARQVYENKGLAHRHPIDI
jgi:very long chain acyl-CoA dehydrogenase